MAKGFGFYGVRKGQRPGIYLSWAECESQVKGFPQAEFAKFKTQSQANEYMKSTLSKTAVIVSNAKASTSRLPPQRKRARSPGQSNEGSSASNRARGMDPVEALNGSSSRRERVVYCDGSSLGNGRSGATAGIGIFWEQTGISCSERLPGNVQTNNRAEMYAIARILEQDLMPHIPLTIATDSEYCINCFQTWIYGWRRKGFFTADGKPVSNRDLILYVLSLIALRSPVKFLKVKAHCGIEGNETADRLAKAGATKGAIQERNYFEDTQRNEALLTRSGRSTVENFVVEISESDLLTYEELRMMELSQDFNS